ncbi:hypothetical protein AB1E18_003076 [Capra hircus]
MIIYRDLISHDEMFSDISKIWEVADGLCLEVEGKMVSRTEGNIDDSLIGGNASAEGPEGEGTESTVITGVDIVMNHHLQETSFTKEAYKKYIKDYMKSIKGKLEEQRPERVKPFMTGAVEQIKHILANFKNYQFFIGENMNPDGMVALLDYPVKVGLAEAIRLGSEEFFPPTLVQWSLVRTRQRVESAKGKARQGRRVFEVLQFSSQC